MPTLKQYILSLTGNNEKIFAEYGSGKYLADLEVMTSQIQLFNYRQDKKILIPSRLLYNADNCYHSEFVDSVVSYLIEKNISNALILGATDGSTYNVGSHLIFHGYNSAQHLLKSPLFDIIVRIISAKNFLNLLFNFEAIWSPSGVMLWGNIKAKTFKPQRIPVGLSIRRMLYVEQNNLHRTNPIPSKWWELLAEIFENEDFSGKKRKQPPKRFRKLIKLLKVLIKNHERKMKQYPYIFDNICIQSLNEKNHLNLATDKTYVIKFILTIVYTIFPEEMFGGKHNRSVLASKIPMLFNCSIHDLLAMEDVISRIRMNDITWLKPENNNKLTKSEFVRATIYFKNFLRWLFQKFICKLTAAFFHVTEASQGCRPLFFRHDVWARITKKFKSQYFFKHIENKDDIVNGFDSFVKNKDHVGSIKLLPKAKDFRLIVRPFRGTDNEKFEYLTYRKKYLAPINAILRNIRSSSSMGSVSEVIKAIYKFKERLLEKHSGLPELYAFKFDVQRAYDSLPHEKIINVITKKLDEFTNSDKVIVQSMQVLDEEKVPKRIVFKVIDNYEKLLPLQSKSKSLKQITVDKHETFSFTKREIIDFIQSQIKRTCFHTHSRSYYRKIGVYQGFPLSGVMFNIVYDSVLELLHEHLVNNCPQFSEFKIIRLVDDFLLLSTSIKPLLCMRRFIARPIKEYNVNINRLKSQTSTTNISFVGLNIDLRTLTCFKNVRDYNNRPIRINSFTKLYSRLQKYLDVRLKNTLLFAMAESKSGIRGARKNLISLVLSLIWKFLNSFKLIRMKDSFNITLFKNCIMKVVENIGHIICLWDLKLNFKWFWKVILRILMSKRIL